MLVQQGKNLTMKTYGRPPYTVQLENGGVSGTDVQTMQIIAEKMNFNLDAGVGEGWWGEETVNGTYRMFGSMPDVMLGRAHFGGSEIMLLEDVWPYLDYLWHQHADPRLVSGKPKVLPPYLNIFKPFSLEAWIAFWLTMIVVTTIFSLLCYYYGYRDGFISFVTFFMHPFGHGKFC